LKVTHDGRRITVEVTPDGEGLVSPAGSALVARVADSGDQTGEAFAGELRPGNAGANTAAEQIAVAEQALQQIPAEHIETIDLLLRVDSAGACHELLDWCRDARIRFSVGYDLTETVREAILEIADEHWVCALDPDGSQRPTGRSPSSPTCST
jgi:hypothetical protein